MPLACVELLYKPTRTNPHSGGKALPTMKTYPPIQAAPSPLPCPKCRFCLLEALDSAPSVVGGLLDRGVCQVVYLAHSSRMEMVQGVARHVKLCQR